LELATLVVIGTLTNLLLLGVVIVDPLHPVFPCFNLNLSPRIMHAIINFLLQNSNLVSVFGKIPPDFTGRAWQDGQFHEL
jgi:hypothetical protein